MIMIFVIKHAFWLLPGRLAGRRLAHMGLRDQVVI